MEKRCPKCENMKPVDGFAKNRARHDGLDSYCKLCNKLRQQARHAKNPRSEYFAARRNTDEYRQYSRNYKRNREKVDIAYRLRNRLRTRMYVAIQNQQKKGSAVKDLGCSISELMSHIAKQFTGRMSWDNYGEWHIDHIIPLTVFDLTDRAQFLTACHYTNLQPLWGVENIRKGSYT